LNYRLYSDKRINETINIIISLIIIIVWTINHNPERDFLELRTHIGSHQKEKFKIELDTYKQMVSEVLWIEESDINKLDIIWLLNNSEELQSTIGLICEKYNRNVKDFLHRSVVWKRNIENIKSSYKFNNIAYTRVQVILNKSDIELVDKEIHQSLLQTRRLTKWNEGGWIWFLLQSKLWSMPRFWDKRVVEYFASIYYPMHNDKFPDENNSKNIFPDDRDIVDVPFVYMRKILIWTLRWEEDIVKIVLEKLNNWDLNIWKYISSDFDKIKVLGLAQNLINTYYSLLHRVIIHWYDESNNRRKIPFDLEYISNNYKVNNNQNFQVLTPEEFQIKLKNQAIDKIKLKNKFNTKTQIDINSYSQDFTIFEWFSSFLDWYKSHFISALDNNDTTKIEAKPWTKSILEKLWFKYLMPDESPDMKKISIQTEKQEKVIK